MSGREREPGRSSLDSWEGQAELPIVEITPEILPILTEAQKLLDAIPWPSQIFTRALVDEAQISEDLERVRRLAAQADELAGGGTYWRDSLEEQIEWKARPAEPRDDGEAEHFDRMRRRARSVLDMREDSGLKPRHLSYDEARRITRQLLG